MTVAGVPDTVSPTALLLLSELATNSAVHQRSEFVVVRAHLCAGGPRVGIRDSSGHLPSPRVPSTGLDSDSGRGPLLVNAPATRWARSESGHGPVLFFALTWGR